MDWNLRTLVSPPVPVGVVSIANGLESPNQYLRPYQLVWYRSRMGWNLQTSISARTGWCGIDREWIGISSQYLRPVPVAVVSIANGLESPNPVSPPVPVAVVSIANGLESPNPVSPPVPIGVVSIAKGLESPNPVSPPVPVGVVSIMKVGISKPSISARTSWCSIDREWIGISRRVSPPVPVGVVSIANGLESPNPAARTSSVVSIANGLESPNPVSSARTSCSGIDREWIGISESSITARTSCSGIDCEWIGISESEYLRPYQLQWYRSRMGWNLQTQYHLPYRLQWYRLRRDWNLRIQYLRPYQLLLASKC